MSGTKMFERGLIPKRLMWSLRIVLVFPCPQCLLQAWQVEITGIARPELPATGAVQPLHSPVELGAAGWEHIQGNPSLLTGGLKRGHELTAPIDLDRLDGKRHPRDQLGEEVPGGPRRRTGADAHDGDPADDIDRGELAALDPREGP